MQDRAEQRLEARLDRQQYDQRQLISVKIALNHLSYYTSSLTFQRVDGQIEINGIPCQYVERRILGDSLELLCIPNPTVLKLRVGGGNFIKIFNDVQQGDPYLLCQPVALAVVSFDMIQHHDHFTVHLSTTAPGAQDRPPAAV